jgi:hypothetical protein
MNGPRQLGCGFRNLYILFALVPVPTGSLLFIIRTFEGFDPAEKAFE